MPRVINPAPAKIEVMLRHSWLAEDQMAAFTISQFVPAMQSVSNYLSPWLLANKWDAARVKNGICIQDVQITVCLMNQALKFLENAFCNTVGHYILAKEGMETWARVTNYYASFFSIHSLLCIQGRTITRLNLDKELNVQIVPLDFREHIFGITTKHLGKNLHAIPWKWFYEIYDRYAVSHSAYERVSRKAFVADPADESIERNAINYKPFEGFKEIRDFARLQEFSRLFKDYASNLERKASLEEFLADLEGYASDPEHKYFARVLLKIALAGDILSPLCGANIALQNEWTKMNQKWQDFLSAIFPGTSTCYLLKFVPLLGSMDRPPSGLSDSS